MLNQLELENKYSKKALREKIKGDIDVDSPVFTHCCTKIESYLVQQYYPSKDIRVARLHKTNTVCDIVTELFIAVLPIQKLNLIQNVCSALGGRLGFKFILDGIKTASEILAVCESSSLYTLYHSSHANNDTDTLAILANYMVSKELRDAIDNSMFIPPLVSEPAKWVSNTKGGYYTDNSSCILGGLNHHEGKQNLDHLNRLQSIAWTLNLDILGLVESPNKPLKTDEQVEQFLQFKDEAITIRDLILNRGNKFYWKWSYDKRGRSYNKGYHISLQSTEYQKASIQFHREEKLQGI